MHRDVATDARKLPRFVIVPAFVVAGILVQIIAVVPSKSLWKWTGILNIILY